MNPYSQFPSGVLRCAHEAQRGLPIRKWNSDRERWTWTRRINLETHDAGKLLGATHWLGNLSRVTSEDDYAGTWGVPSCRFWHRRSAGRRILRSCVRATYEQYQSDQDTSRNRPPPPKQGCLSRHNNSRWRCWSRIREVRLGCSRGLGPHGVRKSAVVVRALGLIAQRVPSCVRGTNPRFSIGTLRPLRRMTIGVVRPRDLEIRPPNRFPISVASNPQRLVVRWFDHVLAQPNCDFVRE